MPRLGESGAIVIETPGHTLGHIAYHFEDDDVVVVGDTLFSLGCGRVMEGTMPMMHETLMRLADLPGETQVYCGHEYTQANARFAVTVDPDNALLTERVQEVDDLRAERRLHLADDHRARMRDQPLFARGQSGVAEITRF